MTLPCVLQCLGKRTVRKTDELMSASSWFVSVVMTEAGPASLSPRASFDVTTDQVPVALADEARAASWLQALLLYAHGEAGLQGPAGGQRRISKMLWIHQGLRRGSRAG